MHLRYLCLPDDTADLIFGMRDFVDRMDYHEFLPDSDEELVNSVQRLLDLGVVEILVADHKGVIVGGIGMLYAPCMWNSKIMNAEEIFFWVAPDAPPTTALRLIRGVRNKSREYGAHIITLKSLTSTPEKLDKIYRSMNLRPVETSYMGIC